jgi:hypothetical protein
MARLRDLMARFSRNERPESDVVKALMDRMKVTLVALLPALWLMASGQYFLDPCGNCPAASASDSSFAFEKGQHCSSNEAGSIDLSARRTNLRVGAQSAKSNFFPVGPTVGSNSVSQRFSAVLSSNREGPLALATRWQFDCRAAPEPRAPSSVS